ncbi:MAG TPA: O-antigen ligase family protein [Dongiaceae bacterium]|nr:O-antigen ligase family protein [Dongiaceae bacterium]
MVVARLDLRAQTARLDRLRAGLAFLIGLTLPISVSASETLCLLAFLLLLVEWRPAETARLWAANPVAWAGGGLFLLLGVGVLWSTAPWGEAFREWSRYRELLYLPLLLLVCRDEAARRAGLYGFFAAVALILAVGSTTLYPPLARVVGAVIGRVPYDSAFGSYITEGMQVALATYFFSVEAIRHPKHRPLAVALVAWALLYAMFLNTGRTGYVVLIVVAVALLLQLAPRRFWIPGGAAILLAAAVLLFLSPRLHERMLGVGAAIQVQMKGDKVDPSKVPQLPGGIRPTLAETSANARIEFMRIGWQAFQAHPILGTGTGSFARTYAELAEKEHAWPTRNPHSQYVLMAVQLGAVGLLALLAFFATLWLAAGRLPLWESRQARALTAAFALACLFNSMLMDHKDGHTFVFLLALFFGGLGAREDQRRRHDL